MEFFKGTITPMDWAINAGVVALAALLCVIFAFAVMMPGQKKMSALQAEIGKAREDLKVAKDNFDNFEKLESESTDMRNLVGDFEKRLPKKEEIPALSKMFEDFGSDIGLVPNVATKEPKSDKRKAIIPYEVSAEGSFHQIVAFINRLDTYERYFKISDLKIEEQVAGVSSAKFLLSTYMIEDAPPEEPAKDEKAGGAKKGTSAK